MRVRYQRGYLRLGQWKTGPVRWEFLWWTANLPECASGAKQSLVPSCNIQIWKTLGKRVMVSAHRSTKHAIVSVNRLLRAALLPWAHRTRLQQLRQSLLTTNVSNESGNLLFAQK